MFLHQKKKNNTTSYDYAKKRTDFDKDCT